MSDDLRHYGILGMRWGIRRKRNVSPEAARAAAIKKKHISEMTNDELKELSTRLSLEKNLRDLGGQKKSVLERLVVDTLLQVGQQQVSTIAKMVVEKQAERLAELLKQRLAKG